MFPDACGAEFARAVGHGADPETVVPDDYFVVHGGEKDIVADDRISCTVGPTLEAAAAAVPHGAIRWTTVGQVRARGGTVGWMPERSRSGTLNQQHVNVKLPGGVVGFSALQKNPVKRSQRIDGTP
jgi:hypothetical protein